MYKKFLIGMAALCVSLFFIGCETEVEKIVNTTTPDEGIYYPVQVENEDALRAALASGLKGAIAFHGAGGVETFTGGVLEIPEDRTVGFFSPVVLGIGGLDIKGTVYVEYGGKLTAASTKEITVSGSLYVKKGGTLATDAATSVKYGEGSALDTTHVRISGSLEIGVASPAEATAALVYVTASDAWLVLNSSVGASAFNDFAVPAGKLVRLEVDANDAGTTISVPAGLVVVIKSDRTTVNLTEVVVDGSLYVAATSFGAVGGLQITVNNGAVAHLGTVAKLATGSTVAAGGELNIAAITAVASGATIVASGGATVNDITFPAGEATFEISNITELGVEVKDDFEVPEGWTLTGDLVIPAAKVLTLTHDLVLGNRLGSGVPGSISVYLSSGSVAFVGATSDGAKTAGEGKIIVADTEIAGEWQAVDASGAAVTIALEGNSASSITASASGVVFTAADGATITQKAGAGTGLKIGTATEIALGGDGTAVGSIVLTGDATNPGKLTFADVGSNDVGTSLVTTAATSADTKVTGTVTVPATGTALVWYAANATTGGKWSKVGASNATNGLTGGGAGANVTLSGATTITVQ
jgi:hypothetical protein